MDADTGKVTATPDVGAGNDARSSTLKRQTPLPRQADQQPSPWFRRIQVLPNTFVVLVIGT